MIFNIRYLEYSRTTDHPMDIPMILKRKNGGNMEKTKSSLNFGNRSLFLRKIAGFYNRDKTANNLPRNFAALFSEFEVRMKKPIGVLIFEVTCTDREFVNI